MTSAGETCFQFVGGNDACTGVFVYVGTVRKQSFYLHVGLWVKTMRQTVIIWCVLTYTQPEKYP